MLLRRVIAHLRKQEWTAIAIDFVIVVVGVFVGLQVNNWNEARIERAREAFAIAALRSDFQALDFSVSHGVCWHRRALDGLQVIAEALNAGRLDPELRARFENGLRFGYLSASTNKASGALSELLSSGNMGRLRDPQLRAALIQYEGSRETAWKLLRFWWLFMHWPDFGEAASSSFGTRDSWRPPRCCLWAVMLFLTS